MNTILFDLDGTLTDPFVGITTSIQYALERMGAKVPSNEDLAFCIGPSLWESFATLLENDERSVLDEAVRLYRERYTAVGLFENEVYPNIAQVLTELKQAGFTLFVCTSKPHTYAGLILEHFDLSQYFDKVYGCELDGTFSHKPDLMRHLLATEQLSSEKTVMIGDRKHDLVAATENNVGAIGVSWGYGSMEELEAHKPMTIVHSALELASVLKAMREETLAAL